jgi:hypothetical protein
VTDKFQFSEHVLFRLAADCLPIAERYFSNANRLVDIGFRRHNLKLSSGDDFCTIKEIEESKKIWHEISKELVASYGPRPTPLFWHIAGFKSDLLENIRRQREKDGLTIEWERTAAIERWKYELAPVDRILEREKMNYSGLSSDPWAKHLEKYWKSYEEIIRLETIALGGTSNLPNIGARSKTEIELWPSIEQMRELRPITQSLLNRQLAPHNFTYSKKISGASWFVFVREIAPKIQLRFGFELGTQTLKSHLFVCSDSLPKRPDGPLGNLYKWQDYFEIRLTDATPGGGKYERFRSLSELVISIKAATAIYSLEADYISFMLSGIFDPEKGWIRNCHHL